MLRERAQSPYDTMVPGELAWSRNSLAKRSGEAAPGRAQTYFLPFPRIGTLWLDHRTWAIPWNRTRLACSRRFAATTAI